MATQDEALRYNEIVMHSLSTPGMEKTAVDAVTDFTRRKEREAGFKSKFLPEIPITNDQLHPQVDTEKPARVVELEPNSPGAMQLPYSTQPVEWIFYGSKYRVLFARYATHRFEKDVDELRTYQMDIRQIISDNAIKDMLAEEDSKFIMGVNAVLVNPDVPLLWSGVPQWETISGGFSRETVVSMRQIVTRNDAGLESVKALCNNTTIKELEKWYRDEAGGDLSQQLLENGIITTKFAGLEWVSTIKRRLVPDNRVYMFTDPQFMGKNFVLENTTMYIKRDGFMLEFYAYKNCGGAFGNVAGITCATVV